MRRQLSARSRRARTGRTISSCTVVRDIGHGNRVIFRPIAGSVGRVRNLFGLPDVARTGLHARHRTASTGIAVSHRLVLGHRHLFPRGSVSGVRNVVDHNPRAGLVAGHLTLPGLQAAIGIGCRYRHASISSRRCRDATALLFAATGAPQPIKQGTRISCGRENCNRHGHQHECTGQLCEPFHEPTPRVWKAHFAEPQISTRSKSVLRGHRDPAALALHCLRLQSLSCQNSSQDPGMQVAEKLDHNSEMERTKN